MPRLAGGDREDLAIARAAAARSDATTRSGRRVRRSPAVRRRLWQRCRRAPCHASGWSNSFGLLVVLGSSVAQGNRRREDDRRECCASPSPKPQVLFIDAFPPPPEPRSLPGCSSCACWRRAQFSLRAREAILDPLRGSARRRASHAGLLRAAPASDGSRCGFPSAQCACSCLFRADRTFVSHVFAMVTASRRGRPRERQHSHPTHRRTCRSRRPTHAARSNSRCRTPRRSQYLR